MMLSRDIASAGQTFSHGFEQSGGQSSGSNSGEQTSFIQMRKSLSRYQVYPN